MNWLYNELTVCYKRLYVNILFYTISSQLPIHITTYIYKTLVYTLHGVKTDTQGSIQHPKQDNAPQ